MQIGDLEIRDSLPASFYSAFTDEDAKKHACAIETWAQAHNLKFGCKSVDQDLPTWYIITDTPSGPTFLLTMQPLHEITNASGRRQEQGILDVPFHRMNDAPFGEMSNRRELLEQLHRVLPQGKPMDTSKTSSWWPIGWRPLVESHKLARFLGVLEAAVVQMRNQPVGMAP